MASQNGHHQVVNLLIKAQADVNLQTNTGESPLYIASQECHHQVVNLLIKAQADVNLQTNSGESPLYIASQECHYQVVDSLIKAQANVNLQTNTGSSPLYIASVYGHHQVVDSLLKAQADVNLQEFDGCSPLYIASQEGHHQVVDSLIKAQADVNLQENNGVSPLYIASDNDHHKVVDSLIKAQADVNLQTNTGSSPLYIASKNGHNQIVDSLIKAQADFLLEQDNNDESPIRIALQNGYHLSGDSVSNSCSLTDTELSHQLHSALTQSGFVDSRAALQSAVAQVLQKILGERLNHSVEKTFIVGSNSEGWGNSLVTLDGRTDIDSDIDVMRLISGRLYHLRDLCKCHGIMNAQQQVEYTNGHILCSGFASTPASHFDGSSLRPAVDDVKACRLCCYPPIAPLIPPRVSKSNIPQSLLQSLQHELTTSPCHVVHATTPGQEGQQLRVSTTFLEKRLLQSLSTLQGQLFVTLKYLVKKVISHRVKGVKAYHAKTTMFRMLEETPIDEWKPKNLMSLMRRSLQMMLESVKCSSNNADGRIMDHFFLCEAALYPKGVGQFLDHKSAKHDEEEQPTTNRRIDQTSAPPAPQESALKSGRFISRTFEIMQKNIRTVLTDVINELPQLLIEFKASLKPISTSGTFQFHPFLALPILNSNDVPMNASLKYHEIYDVVRESLVQLSQGDCSIESQASLTEMIDRLPDCARSAREALRALACLKFGDKDGAVRVLNNCGGHKVSRGIEWSAERTKAEATEDFVWQHLRGCDSAWKFCFEFDQRPIMNFLGIFLTEYFPLAMHIWRRFFMNFDALLQGLRFELMTDDVGPEDWIREVMQREDADEQELLVAMMICDDIEMLKQISKLLWRQTRNNS